MQQVHFLIFFLAVSSTTARLSVGNKCTHNGQPGICVVSTNCHSTAEDFKEGKKPTICVTDDRHPVVCCPEVNHIQKRSSEQPGDKAAKMCEEYGESAWGHRTVPSSNLCYDSTRGSLNSLGTKTSPTEFPHMALIGFGNEDKIDLLCAGSLISPRFVLAAAHCQRPGKDGTPIWVRVGDISINGTSSEGKPQVVKVTERIPHPDYKGMTNDIALLKLDRDLEMNEYVRPACLHTKFEIDETSAISTGWNLRISDKFPHSEILLKDTLPIYPAEKCTEHYRRFNVDGKTILCVGHMAAPDDTCLAIGGGPLQVLMKTPHCMYEILGIVSFGPRICGKDSPPDSYTRVSHYIDWIEKTVWP